MQTNNSDNNWTELKIIEPITKYSKEFNTPDEFNLWYSKHKNEVDSQTTHRLNKLYHVKGYRITKIKGILMLKKWTEEQKESSNNIEEEIQEMKNAINSIIRYLKGETEQIAPDDNYEHTAVSAMPQAHIALSPPDVT